MGYPAQRLAYLRGGSALRWGCGGVHAEPVEASLSATIPSSSSSGPSQHPRGSRRRRRWRDVPHHDGARADERLLADRSGQASRRLRPAPRRIVGPFTSSRRCSGSAHEVVVRGDHAGRDEDVSSSGFEYAVTYASAWIFVSVADRGVVLTSEPRPTTTSSPIVAALADAVTGRRRITRAPTFDPANTTAPVEKLIPSPSVERRRALRASRLTAARASAACRRRCLEHFAAFADSLPGRRSRQVDL